MSRQLFANNAKTTLTQSISASDTTLPVASTAGFPTPSNGAYIKVTLDDGINREVIKVYGVSSTSFLSVVRGVENGPFAFSTGVVAENRVTAGTLADFATVYDRLSEYTLVSDLPSASSFSGNSALIHDKDQSGEVIRAYLLNGLWSFPSYPFTSVSGTASGGSTTTLTYANIANNLPDFTSDAYLVQFTTGPLVGLVRKVFSVAQNQLTWTQALPYTVDAATTFVVLQSHNLWRNSVPAMDGVGTAGTSQQPARGDHVHPTDTTRAPLASPAFTGTPTVPTPTAGDSSSQVSNTSFVQTAVQNATGSILVKSVAGNSDVSLSTTEINNAILQLTGTLTGNISVIVQNGVSKQWLVANLTSGLFTLTFRTSATSGTGVSVPYGKVMHVYSDGVNVLPAANVILNGSVDNSPIGATTSSTAAVTTLSSSGNTNLATGAGSKVGVGTITSPTVTMAVGGTDALKIPAGTNAQRPSNEQALLRYNTDSNRFEGNNGNAWGSLGGATGGGNDAVFYLNSQTITSNYTLAAGQNAGTFGPVTINDGVTVTISDGSTWTIV